MAVKIFDVTTGSHADKAGIKKGETLLSINSNEIVDVLDYRFYQVNRKLTLEVEDEDKNVRTIEMTKGEYEEIGLEFETYLMDKQHSCRNKCIFCFIDQLPKGMRESLYFKDDGSRLSFLFGNYITLTNITEHEIDRIIKMHISPINVSVHTTNPELRCKMMNNRFAGDTLKYLKRFADAGITLNCQIVSCPGINDGDELVRTLTDLENLGVNAGRIGITVNGVERSVNISDNETIQSFIDKLKEIGVDASFNSTTGVFTVNLDTADINDYDNTGIVNALHLIGVNEGYTSDKLQIEKTETVYESADESSLLNELSSGIKIIGTQNVIVQNTNGENYTIEVDAFTTLGEFLTALEDTGLNASIKNGVVEISGGKITG